MKEIFTQKSVNEFELIAHSSYSLLVFASVSLKSEEVVLKCELVNKSRVRCFRV